MLHLKRVIKTDKIKKLISNRDIFCWFLTLFSILLWNISIYYSNTNFESWGIFNGLHFSYYIGLVLAIINVSLCIFVIRKKKLTFISFLIFFFYLYGISIFITLTPRINAGFKYIGHWEYLDRVKQLDLWYHSWPGSFFLTGLLTSSINNPSKYIFIFREIILPT